MNKFPLWLNTLVLAILLSGCLFALPNIYGSVPAVQLSCGSAPADQLTLGNCPPWTWRLGSWPRVNCTLRPGFGIGGRPWPAAE